MHIHVVLLKNVVMFKLLLKNVVEAFVRMSAMRYGEGLHYVYQVAIEKKAKMLQYAVMMNRKVKRVDFKDVKKIGLTNLLIVMEWQPMVPGIAALTMVNVLEIIPLVKTLKSLICRMNYLSKTRSLLT
jgi:hypothetical protein